MVRFKCTIKRFQAAAEKTGWTFVEIPATVASKIKPDTKKSFRIKGKIDGHAIEKVSILPMGEGDFIMPLNKTMRKAIAKNVGATVTLELAEDKRQLEIYPELIACLRDEPEAYKWFMQLTPSHQRYFSKWITDAKTEQTRAKRIANTVTTMLRKQGFGEALRLRTG
jgi:hypothetical protein